MSLGQTADEVVVLKVALQLDLAVCVHPLPVHLIRRPLPVVIALISPRVNPRPLPIAVLELPLVNVSVREQVMPFDKND